jgi:ABC-type lipoprotein export system ATPase subunit/ABC-type antimicrobial peptide transport system permease subunit
MIKITKLNKYFYRKRSNEIHVINDVSISFPDHGLVTILGESGCGKTTLLNVLGGLDDFDKGTIEFDDKKISKYSWRTMDKIRNEKIGYIFQNYLLLPQRTVFDNLKILLNMYDISNQEKEERINYVLEAVGMIRYKKKNVTELSGGQQQRVAIARALLKSPSLILADEPTGNLDEKNTIQIMNIIKKISKKILVILVSHEKNIATSYSDYIIEIKDGKIENQSSLDGSESYTYEDDQNIYLKEYQYNKIESDNVNIDFYSNEETKINLQIVYSNGKFIVKTNDNVVLLDKNSEINLIDDYKQELDTEKEVEQNDFELKPLKMTKTPSLTSKERINLALSNLTKLKKRTAFLMFPLFVIVALILVSVQSVISASYVNKKELTTLDSRVYNISLEKSDSRLNKSVHTFAFKYFCKEFITNNPNIELSAYFNPSFSFTLPSFSQVSSESYTLDGFGTLTLDQLDASSLIYGKMPSKYNEIVIEKWVIDNLLKDSTLQNFMSVSSFVNKEITLSPGTQKFQIVGIANNNENTSYFNKWALMNIFPSNLKKSTYSVIPLSEYTKYYTNSFVLEKEEFIANEAYLDSNITSIHLNDDKFVNVSKISNVNHADLPYKVIVSDELYNDLQISLLSTNYTKLNVICENNLEKAQVISYVKDKYEFYSTGQLFASEENGYDTSIPADLKTVFITLEAYSEYDSFLESYIVSAKNAMTSRLLVTFTILVLSMLIVFFSMKSYAIKNIYDIGVFRAIGINKRSIIFIYGLQIFIISLRSTLVGAVVYYLVTSLVASIPLINIPIAMDFGIFTLCTSGLILINILVGVLPVIMYLKKTPSQLLSKYDV